MLESRKLIINTAPFSGSSVVYVMSRDQRSTDNHALLAAQQMAIQESVPLYVVFVLRNVGNRSREHYEFMLTGLEEVQKNLENKGIPFVLKKGDFKEQVLTASRELEAGALFFDFSPLTHARTAVKQIAKDFNGAVTVVDTHNIIPAWIASDKKEFAAHTMRSKVHKKLEAYLVAPEKLMKQPMPSAKVSSVTFDKARDYISALPSAGITLAAKPGEAAAHKQLSACIDTIEHYATGRNNIAVDQQSGLSPYLHFGQISSLTVALEVISAVNEPPLLLEMAKLVTPGDVPSGIDGMNALLEELIVRKELADNFCLYSDDYMSLSGAPEWAKKSLAEHQHDPRDFIYTKEEWESAHTHDEIWNASQKELTTTGKMHGYMRMYWAKKILEWSASPEEAIQIAIYLNDKYSVDGGDPNGYVGILWSITGLHDRPWFERPVYGKIRYMNSGGLQRKFKVNKYIERVDSLDLIAKHD